MKLTTKQLTLCAVLTAMALALSYLENLFPLSLAIPLPGIKLGLANTVLLYSVYLLGPGYSVILMILKVVLTGFMSGNLAAAFLYSMGGGALSLGMMLLVKKLGGNDKVSIVGVSVVGAVFHNVGQLLVASLVVRTPGLMLYIFPLLISAVVTGVITGLAGRQIVRVLRLPGAPDPLSSKTKDPGEDT